MKSRQDTAKLIFTAGLIGGLMEILWVSFYGLVTNTPVLPVSQEITATLVGSSTLSVTPGILGIAAHMLLSLLLSAVFVLGLWQPFVSQRTPLLGMVSALAALTLVWAVNFFVVLPIINPRFVTLLPMGVTLTSKMLFGLGMGAFLVLHSRVTSRVAHS